MLTLIAEAKIRTSPTKPAVSGTAQLEIKNTNEKLDNRGADSQILLNEE